MRLASLLVASGLLLPTMLGAAAQEPPPPPPMPGMTKIHLMQQATRMVPPDRLRAELRVEIKGNDARQVQAEVNRRMEAALAKAKTHADTMAETGAYTVNRDYSVANKQVWQADQSLILTSADFGGLLTLVGQLQGDGLLVSEMQFFLARETLANTQSALTAAALDALKARADEVARDLGMQVDHFEDLTVGNANASTNPVPFPRFAMALAAVPAAPPPTAQAGDATVSLAVSADVMLARGRP
ncbi:MAG TPA: SIMPL domain-containing protein [Stellaceae bacterium]|nr:SIMPL domain-containing protein [Stellaceae bacterium]